MASPPIRSNSSQAMHFYKEGEKMHGRPRTLPQGWNYPILNPTSLRYPSSYFGNRMLRDFWTGSDIGVRKLACAFLGAGLPAPNKEWKQVADAPKPLWRRSASMKTKRRQATALQKARPSSGSPIAVFPELRGWRSHRLRKAISISSITPRHDWSRA